MVAAVACVAVLETAVRRTRRRVFGIDYRLHRPCRVVVANGYGLEEIAAMIQPTEKSTGTALGECYGSGRFPA